MKPLQFIKEIRKSVIEDNLNTYRYLFENTQENSVTDSYWKEALQFYNKLDINEKKVFFKILRQVEVDTVSNIFSILDGVSWLEEQQDNFKLVENNSNEVINGELQDKFLEIEEDN